MADRLPNYKIEIKRLKVDILQNELNIERNELRVMDLEDEKNKIVANTEAIKKSIKEDKEKLASLIKEHGE